MIDVLIQTTSDTHYPTKVKMLPKVGDRITLDSYSDLACGSPFTKEYVVTSINHNLVEIKEYDARIKEHYHHIIVNVTPRNVTI